MQPISNNLQREIIVANKIHQTLNVLIDTKLPEEGGSVPGTFGQFTFRILNEKSHFNVFIEKNKAIFKVDYFKKEDYIDFEETFCKAFNISSKTVDNVLKSYLDVAKDLAGTGILSINIDLLDDTYQNPVSYFSFKSSYSQDYVCVSRLIAQLKFNHAYKKNKRYSDVKGSAIKSELHFYIDQHNDIKPVFIVDAWFDQDYAASFIVDVYADTVYTSRKVLRSKSYEELIAMSRLLCKEQLPEIMHTQFIKRLIPVIKKRYGWKKDQIDLSDVEMRDRYIALLMMESI
jgi:hypothetical protein